MVTSFRISVKVIKVRFKLQSISLVVLLFLFGELYSFIFIVYKAERIKVHLIVFF